MSKRKIQSNPDRPGAASLWRPGLIPILYVVGSVVVSIAFGVGMYWFFQARRNVPEPVAEAERPEAARPQSAPVARAELPEPERLLREAIAEADRLDPGWRWEELEARRAIIPPEQNAALRVQAAGKLLPNPWYPKLQRAVAPDGDQSGSPSPMERFVSAELDSLPPEVQLDNALASALRMELLLQGPALAEARQLPGMLNGRYDRSIDPKWQTPTVDTSSLRVLSLLRMDATLLAQQGQTEKAIESGLAMLNAGRSIGDEPMMISQLIRLACTGRAATSFERTLAQGEPSDDCLQRAQGLLQKECEEAQGSLLICMRAERAGSFMELGALAAGKIDVTEYLTVIDQHRGSPLKGKPEGKLLVAKLLQERGKMLRVGTERVQAAKLPPTKRNARFDEIDAADTPDKELFEGSSTKKTRDFFRMNEAQIRCALLGVAMERYRQRHLAWPRSLDDLVRTKLVERIPEDPFADGHLRFRRLPDGIVVYSLGPHGEDNGGKRANPDNARQAGTNVGFQLWNVARRRQLPLSSVPSIANRSKRPDAQQIVGESTTENAPPDQDRLLREAIAEADQLDPGWRLREMEAKRAVVPDAENSARQVDRARSLLPHEWPTWKAVTTTQNPKEARSQRFAFENSIYELPQNVQLNAQQIAALRTELAELAPAVGEFRKLSTMSRGRFAGNRDPLRFNQTSLHTDKFIEISKLLEWDAALRAQDGDVHGALASCQALGNLGRSLGDDPAIMSNLIRYACVEKAIRAIGRTMAEGSATDASLVATSRLLEEEHTYPRLLTCFRGERALWDGHLEAIQNGTIDSREIIAAENDAKKQAVYWGAFGEALGKAAGDVQRKATQSGATDATVDDKLKSLIATAEDKVKSLPPDASEEATSKRYGPGEIKQLRAWLLLYTTGLVEICKLPLHQQQQAIEQMPSTEGQPELVRFTFLGVGSLARNEISRMASLRCAICGLACERYRLAHGDWPGTLDDLVTRGFLKEVFLDPFDGQKLRFKRVPDGVIIYSARAYRPEYAKDDGKTDVRVTGVDITHPGFQLWDVAKRRQPPAVPTPAPANR